MKVGTIVRTVKKLFTERVPVRGSLLSVSPFCICLLQVSRRTKSVTVDNNNSYHITYTQTSLTAPLKAASASWRRRGDSARNAR